MARRSEGELEQLKSKTAIEYRRVYLFLWTVDEGGSVKGNDGRRKRDVSGKRKEGEGGGGYKKRSNYNKPLDINSFPL